MAITVGQNGLASDFITEAEKNGTPSNDSGRVPQLEADGRLGNFFTRNGQFLTAGETLNGATLPVPVYQNKTDNELYACDANDTSKMKYIGFVISNSTDGNSIKFQGSGIVPGFSSLDEGEKYYVQDTAGTIGTTPGTQEILVGVAISQTELLIMRGKRVASGSASITGSNTSSITLGFRPTKISIVAVGAGVGTYANTLAIGHYLAGSNRCLYKISPANNGTASETSTAGVNGSYAWAVGSDSGGSFGDTHRGIIDTVTDTGFRLNQEKTGGTDRAITIHWIAEGEL